MKRTPGRTATERAQYWTKHILRARAYNDGVTAYCAQHGLQKNNYYHYFHKLRALHPEWGNLKDNDKAARDEERTVSGEVSPRGKKRSYSANYKRKVLNEYDSLPDGDKGAFLRREGLYASHISKWRREPASKPESKSLEAENAQLKAKLAKVEKRLETTEKLLGLQKKIADILGVDLQDRTEQG